MDGDSVVVGYVSIVIDCFVFSDILEICCHGNQLYIHFNDGGQVAWFGLLSTKECVAALFNMNYLREAAEVFPIDPLSCFTYYFF